MKPRLIVTGHSLLCDSIVKDLMPGIYGPHRAFCSCGAWVSGVLSAKDARAWHDEHKINVLKSRGEWEEDNG